MLKLVFSTIKVPSASSSVVGSTFHLPVLSSR